MRQTRKAELVACVLGQTPGNLLQGPGLLLDLQLREQQLVRACSIVACVAPTAARLSTQRVLTPPLQAAKMQHHSSRRVMLESWLTEVLAGCSSRQQDVQQQQETGCSSRGRGAADLGLTRPQLVAAGLSATAVDALYRSLFVYSVGFVDEMKVGGPWGMALCSAGVRSAHLSVRCTRPPHCRSCWAAAAAGRRCCRPCGGPTSCSPSTP